MIAVAGEVFESTDNVEHHAMHSCRLPRWFHEAIEFLVLEIALDAIMTVIRSG
jgi:hypothetical protein